MAFARAFCIRVDAPGLGFERRPVGVAGTQMPQEQLVRPRSLGRLGGLRGCAVSGFLRPVGVLLAKRRIVIHHVGPVRQRTSAGSWTRVGHVGAGGTRARWPHYLTRMHHRVVCSRHDITLL